MESGMVEVSQRRVVLGADAPVDSVALKFLSADHWASMGVPEFLNAESTNLPGMGAKIGWSGASLAHLVYSSDSSCTCYSGDG